MNTENTKPEYSGISESISTAQATSENPPTFLTAQGVRKLTGLSESTIRRLRITGDFPAPIRLTPSVSGHLRWYVSEILEWLNSRERV